MSSKPILALLLLVSTDWAQAAPRNSSAAVSLDETIREALAQNLALVAEKWNISVAEARLITASLRRNPVLTLSKDAPGHCLCSQRRSTKKAE